MVTTTTYGTWLPGDTRGYVEKGIVLPANPEREAFALERMASQKPVILTASQQNKVFESLQAASIEFGYELTDASIECWHLHWLISHGYDSIATMVGRLKNRMRQALNIGRIWTEGYYDSRLFNATAIDARRNYIARHDGCRMSNGVLVVH
jgi:hypothetical protein